jgi:hypothetical protein
MQGVSIALVKLWNDDGEVAPFLEPPPPIIDFQYDGGEVSSSFSMIVKNAAEFNISDHVRNKLRWLGRLWLEYKRLDFQELNTERCF